MQDDDGEIHYKSLKLLIAHSFLRYYLDLYSQLLFTLETDPDEVVDMDEEMKQTLESIDMSLQQVGTPFIKTLQLFCLKKLKLQFAMGTE